jgi:MFS family permease
MKKQYSSIQISLDRIRQSLFRLTTGGDWAYSLPVEIQRNLHRFWYDGLFASASDNIIVTYLTLYVLALGATRAQIGLMSSLSSLSAALLLLPGAMLVERFRRRKELTVLFGGLVARFALLLLALIPFFLGEKGLIIGAIALSVGKDAFANLAFPGWISITADIVPMAGRGRYFGSRNFVMGIAGMVTVLAVGELITRVGQPSGYQLAIALAFLLGMISTYNFAQLKEPPPNAPTTPVSMSPRVLWRDIRSHPAFLALAITSALWNFSLNIAGPFFGVYMVQNLKATATLVGMMSVVTSVSSLVFQRRLGKLADKWGAHRMMLISGLLIPILPLSWAFVTSIWHVIPINILSGLFWGAYNLASFNLLLELTPGEQRARYSAIYQIIVTAALAGGAAFGSWLITRWGYVAIFIGSGVGRLTAALLFARFVHRPESPRDEE